LISLSTTCQPHPLRGLLSSSPKGIRSLPRHRLEWPLSVRSPVLRCLKPRSIALARTQNQRHSHARPCCTHILRTAHLFANSYLVLSLDCFDGRKCIHGRMHHGQVGYTDSTERT
jgi:hypothetical protein